MTAARLLSSHHSLMNGFRLFDLQNAVVISGDTALEAGSSYASDVMSDRFFNNIPPGAMQQQAEKMAVNQISGEASESVAMPEMMSCIAMLALIQCGAEPEAIALCSLLDKVQTPFVTSRWERTSSN
jgi:hypothetical protein